MRRTSPTSNPAGTICTTAAAFGLAALLCIGSPAGFANASEPDAAPTPASSSTPTASPRPPSSPAPAPAPAPALPPTPTPTPTPSASPAPAPASTDGTSDRRGGFTFLSPADDSFTAVAEHSARYPWSSVLGNDVNPAGHQVLLDSWNVSMHGTIVSDGSTSFLYTPDPGFTGVDTFTYSIRDDYGNFSLLPGVISITVIPNSTPVAVRDVYSVTAGKPFTAPAGSLLANDTDEDADDLAVVPKVVLGPDHGTATLNANGDGGFTYTPTAGYTGFDSFFYRVSDGHGGTSSLAAVELTVKGTFVTVKPKITGTAAVGSPLSITVGSWSPTPTTVKYQWLRDGSPISGAVAKSYLPTSADLGHSLRATVTGSKPGYPTAQVSSAGTSAVIAGTFASAPAPSIAGTPKVGRTLTAQSAAWAPATTSLSYQWKRSGVAIPGATAPTYVLTATDRGKTVTVVVTGKRNGFTSVSKTSPATAAIGAGILTAPTPTIIGTPKVGSLLTAKAGTWAPLPVTLSHQWKRNGVPIPGATASTYKPVAADAGAKVTVSVKGSKTGYISSTRTSAPTTTIAK